MSWKCLPLTLCFLTLASHPAWSKDEFDDLKTISRLPTSSLEVASAHSRSRADACEQIAAGEPVSIHSFTTFLTQRDRGSRSAARGERPRASSRHPAFSVGIEFDTQDRNALPTLSRSTIVDYVDEHFVSIQVRMRRDLLDRKIYFYHRPIALTFAYRGSRLSQ